MRAEKLVRMANQIAAFFETASDNNPEAEVADHLNRFWEPRMRRQLVEIARTDQGRMHELVRAALPLLSLPDQDRSATSPS